MNTNNADNMAITEYQAQYDAQVKKILADKLNLAWIMRDVVSEFAGMELDKIVQCIEGDPQISEIPVKADMPAITGLSAEDKSVKEGTIYYDIRFYAYAPGDNKPIKIFLNVEAQKKYNPGYSISTRGIFYGARMLSSQLETEFTLPNYDGLKKVVSIWLCMNPPKYIGNAISEYSIQKRDIIKGIPDKKQEYDKLSVVVICLREDMETDNRLVGMLCTLLSQSLSAKEKKEFLAEQYNIPITRDMEKEVNSMCNLSELLVEKGVKQGLEQGHEKAIKTIALNMLKKNMSDKEIMELSGISAEGLKEIKASLQPV